MIWTSVGDFFSMGGYAWYVWGSYAVTLGLLAIEVAALVSKERNTVKRLQRHAVEQGPAR